MTRALRCLPLLVLLLLGSCQSSPQGDAGSPAPQAQQPTQPALSAAPDGLRQQFETQLASGQLAAAGATLERLRQQESSAPALDSYQRLLADAWLQRSQQALEKGDLNAATTALTKARTLMPKAPALTGGALQPKAPAAVDSESVIPE
ncbi:hypothetical protein SAMN05216201_12232 [Pseudomonas linyingensis]|uniref:Tetratricopeptide repeat-containing protein n=1 Tax=Pseudomonas linyingensis TaxID=915471 RepID=A0A1H7CAP3_9PSED|nr:hypothetical protein SAMN05216201_12232 [Pseudomonas linyingensis]